MRHKLFVVRVDKLWEFSGHRVINILQRISLMSCCRLGKNYSLLQAVKFLELDLKLRKLLKNFNQHFVDFLKSLWRHKWESNVDMWRPSSVGRIMLLSDGLYLFNTLICDNSKRCVGDCAFFCVHQQQKISYSNSNQLKNSKNVQKTERFPFISADLFFYSIQFYFLLNYFMGFIIKSNRQIYPLIPMSEEEEFYKALPFTISEEQANPDYLILGTGLQECLIAAHYSKMHLKTGLILDVDKTYGSCLKTLTFKELHRLNIGKVKENLYTFLSLPSYHEKNVQFYKEMIEKKAHRGYSIDIEPNYFFAESATCSLLREADMDKYMDFRLVQNMLHYDGKSFKNVPLSKGKIFESKDLGLLEKKLLLNTFHCLTQIFNKYKEVNEDQNSTKQFDKQFGKVDEKLYQEFLKVIDQPFMEFLSKLAKGNKKIIDYIAYIICNYQYSFGKGEKVEEVPEFLDKQYTVAGFISRFGKFLKSCGVYGQSPYLYVDNGIGDVPQSFSRIASIYGSTYILHPKITIDSIEIKEGGNQLGKYAEISSNLYPDKKITAKKVYIGPTFYDMKYPDSKEFNTEISLRIMLLCEKMGSEEECPSITYLLNIPEFQNPVYLFMFDSSSHTCPNSKILYQFETVLTGKQKTHQGEELQKNAEGKLNTLIKILHNVRGEEFSQSIQYVCAYVREKRHPKGSSKSKDQQKDKIEILLRDHNGIDLDSHFLNFKEVVGSNLGNYFKKQEKVEEEDEWQADEETLNLLQKLENININAKEEQKLEGEIQSENKDETKQQEIEEKSNNKKEEQNKNQCFESIKEEKQKKQQGKEGKEEFQQQIDKNKEQKQVRIEGTEQKEGK